MECSSTDGLTGFEDIPALVEGEQERTLFCCFLCCNIDSLFVVHPHLCYFAHRLLQMEGSSKGSRSAIWRP